MATQPVVHHLACVVSGVNFVATATRLANAGGKPMVCVTWVRNGITIFEETISPRHVAGYPATTVAVHDTAGFISLYVDSANQVGLTELESIVDRRWPKLVR
jgi:hypothetical protein